MIDKSILILWLIWYYYRYGTPPILLHFFINLYHLSEDFLTYLNKLMYGDFSYDDVLETTDEKEIKEPPKYEDKYLKDIRNLNKEWNFTEEENNDRNKFIQENVIMNKKKVSDRMEEIIKEIITLETDTSEDIDSFTYIQKIDDEDEIFHRKCTEERRETIRQLQEEYSKIQLHNESEDVLNELHKQAKQYIINKRLDKLENCYAIEKTPIGNVLMFYDKNKESFKYYSDCNIPYRYLEVVGRKYVKLFNCRPIFIDIEEELQLFEEKWEKEQEVKKLKEEEEKKCETQEDNNEISKKKNVFTKFKSYNKEAGTKISMAPPPKNSIPNKNIHVIKENEKILLKEKANRYTYDGKFSNFNFLKKIEKKVFNKKLGLSFSDFKKMSK
jgi:hypothetical protein